MKFMKLIDTMLALSYDKKHTNICEYQYQQIIKVVLKPMQLVWFKDKYRFDKIEGFEKLSSNGTMPQ